MDTSGGRDSCGQTPGYKAPCDTVMPMSSPRVKSAIDAATYRLRELLKSIPEGTLLGSEEALTEQLGVSRTTIRQVARLLEREGMLRVRRGINGGYFAARPDLNTIATMVSTYLEIQDTEVQDFNAVASILWVEVLRRAAEIQSPDRRDQLCNLRERLQQLREDAPFAEVIDIELDSRDTFFALIKSPHIEMIFQLNVAFTQRHFPTNPSDRDDTDEHRAFVSRWRDAKRLELDAVAEGDRELAAMAGRYCRKLWHQRLWCRD